MMRDPWNRGIAIATLVVVMTMLVVKADVIAIAAQKPWCEVRGGTLAYIKAWGGWHCITFIQFTGDEDGRKSVQRIDL